MRKVAILALFCLMLANAKSQNEKGTVKMCGMENRNPPPLLRTVTKGIQSNAAKLIDNNGVITIPVVVHAIHSSSADYVSDAAIISQINQLNIDFRKLNLSEIAGIPTANWAGLPADAKIEFKLACMAPDGSSTNGIDRIIEADPRPKTLDYYNGFTPWPVNTYLNIWIFNTAGVYGYGTPPWGDGNNTDGIVLDFEVVGQGNGHAYYGQGKVLTHEVGHWLGLYHPHNETTTGGVTCNDDFVGDTPLQYYHHQGTCPSFPQLNDPCNSDPVNGVLFINYMDYGNDPCRYIFTNGQAARMRTYIADGGTPYSRNANLRNYFGFGSNAIKDYTVAACQNFTIKVSNPLCLSYAPTLTQGQGLVTIVSYTLHSITVRVSDGVPCSGSFSIDITSPNFNYTDLGRFTYTVAGCVSQTPNCSVPQIWPKVYESVNDYIAQPIVSSGSLFFTGFPAFNAGNNINHNGPLPPNPIGAATINYDIATGASTMAINHVEPIFALSNGYVQVAPSPYLTSPPTVSYNTSFYNGATGQPVTSSIPLNERILAQTADGYYISHTATAIKVRNALGTVTYTTALSFSPNRVNSFYNVASKKLYIYNRNNLIHQWHVYTYNAVTKTLGSPVAFTYDIEKVGIITNADKLIVNRGTTWPTVLLESYDYVTGQHTPLPAIIGSFVNANFELNRYLGKTTQNQLLVYKYAENKLYLIDVLANTSKSIGIVPSVGCQTYMGYAFLGNDIILSGWGFAAPVTIGGQTMYIYPGMYNYITKFNTINDFSRQAAAVPPKGEMEMEPIISLSPNPAKNSLAVNLSKAFGNTAALYQIEIKDVLGTVWLQSKEQQTLFTLDIARLPTGVYYLTATTAKGEKCATHFMKE
jgi:hypothetical protein